MKSQYLESGRIPLTALQETFFKRHFWSCWFWRLVTFKNLRLNFHSIMKSLNKAMQDSTDRAMRFPINHFPSGAPHHCTKLFNFFYTTRRWHMYRTEQNKHCQRQKSFKILFNLHQSMVWPRVRNTCNNLKNQCNSPGKSMYQF